MTLLKPQKQTHGGGTAKGNPRDRRPLSSKRPIHLVIRSSMAHGERSFLRRKNAEPIRRLVQKHAKICGVRVYDFANGGNHLHFIVKITNERLFARFLRVITGLIARLVMKAERGEAKLKGRKFWDARPFTRIANWGRAYEILRAYLVLNKFEALGFVKHQVRDGKRKVFTIKAEPDEQPYAPKKPLR